MKELFGRQNENGKRFSCTKQQIGLGLLARIDIDGRTQGLRFDRVGLCSHLKVGRFVLES